MGVTVEKGVNKMRVGVSPERAGGLEPTAAAAKKKRMGGWEKRLKGHWAWGNGTGYGGVYGRYTVRRN